MVTDSFVQTFLQSSNVLLLSICLKTGWESPQILGRMEKNPVLTGTACQQQHRHYLRSVVAALLCTEVQQNSAPPAFPGACGAVPCTLPAPCNAKAALVKSADTLPCSTMGQHANLTVCWGSSPCLCYGIAQVFLLQAPTCVCRSSLAQSVVSPGFLANLHQLQLAQQLVP